MSVVPKGYLPQSNSVLNSHVMSGDVNRDSRTALTTGDAETLFMVSDKVGPDMYGNLTRRQDP